MIVDGFRREIRSGIASIMGDVQLTASAPGFYGEGEPVAADDSLLSAIRAVGGVETVTPAIYRTAVVRSGEGLRGVIVKAVRPEGDSALSIRIPVSLSRRLGVGCGDYLPTYFIGEKVKVRRFRVREVYPDLLRTDDHAIVYASMPDLRRVNGWDSLQVSALEVGLSGRYDDPGRQRSKAAELALVSSLAAMPSVQRYGRLFDWLHLLDFNVLAILLLMTLVAGFNMVSGLLIMLFRNTGTIGTLKALGMSDRGVAGVFLRVASRVVLQGMATGGGAALLFALVQGTTHVLKLNPENYFVSWVPVDVNFIKIAVVCAAAFLLIRLMLLLPALFISRVDPADTVRVK